MSTRPLKTIGQQKESLRALAQFAINPADGQCNYGALLLVSAPGDVPALAPVAPELRGVEIVSASSGHGDGRDYDIWKRARKGSPPEPVALNLTAADVVAWLRSRCRRAEADFRRHLVEWVEDTLSFYGASGQ